MQKMTPCLWFDGNAEEAVDFYVSIFKRSRIKGVSYHGETAAKASGQPEGSVMTILFELDGQEFLALNGGSNFTFSPAISFIANCNTQKEIDTLWKKLSAGGQIMGCGWLTDKFGVSWQINPTLVRKAILSGKDPVRADRVMRALVQMKKLDLARLQKAYGS